MARTTLAPAGVAATYERVTPAIRHTTEITAAFIITLLNVLHTLIDVNAGKMIRLEINNAPIIRIPSTIAIPVVIVAAILLLRISGNAKIKGDAAIALISTTSLAVGVMVISLTTGMNTDVYNYMFGSILAMSAEDVKLSLVLSVFVLILFIVFYHKIFAITFDETFARATGVKAGVYNTLIAVLTAVTIVLGMRMMGALLISSLIIFPELRS